jgi:putative ABC transport system permease protein
VFNQAKRQPVRPHLWVIRLIGVIVPSRLRADWRQEWEAELRYRERLLAEWDRLDWRNKRELLRRSTSAFWDALWLQQQRWEDEMIQDLRYGLRMLRKNPGFTAIAVITLALGIGANTAIFSVVNAVLLRPLPYPDSGRLAMVWQKYTIRGWGLVPVSYPNFVAIREQSQVFEDLSATSYYLYNLTADDSPERLMGMRVSDNFFSVLGVSPAIGRVILPEEDRTGTQRVVILSHGLWQRRFGSDAGIVGKSLALNGEAYTVAGVMPPDFQYPPPFNITMASTWYSMPKADLWVPLPKAATQTSVGSRNYHLIGRLKPGVSPAQAQAEMNAIAGRLEQQYPGPNTGLELSLTTLFEQVVGSVRQALWILFGVVGFILLIACANVANMLLTKASGRRRELAVRLAVGASRLRLIRQLLIESLMLASLGGVLGILLANWGCKLLIAINPEKLPRIMEIQLNWYALCFTAAVTLLTGIIFGLMPALQASKLDLNESLKEGGRSATGGFTGSRSRQLLVVGEVALSLVLLIGAGLLLRSFATLIAVDPGFNPERLLTLNLTLTGTNYGTQNQQTGFYQQLLQRIEHLPGVEAVGAVNSLPLTGDAGNSGLTIEGRPPVSPNERPHPAYRVINPDYFRALGIPLQRGRAFTIGDASGSPLVAIINQSAARVFWPNEDPLGKRIRPDIVPPDQWLTIVGVVSDVRHASLNVAPQPEVYWPFLQNPDRRINLLIRTTADPLNLAGAVRSEIRAIDRALPVSNLKSMDELLSDSVAQWRFYTLLLTAFAAVALLLAIVGLYGVISYAVSQRTHEIGIRMALGASPRDVLRLIINHGLVLTLAGVGLGLAAALGLTRVLKNLLFHVSTTDPAIFVGIVLLLAGVASLACYLPARRATKVDPITALRDE